MIAAAGLDLLLGDPRWCPHPVVWMGRCITIVRRCVERLAGDNRLGLRAGGGLITLVLVLGSGTCGWALERLVLPGSPLPSPWAAAVLVVGLASSLAARSLRDSVLAVVDALPDLVAARRSLAWIVGRDTEALDQDEILRAAAETASENAVDGLFAPLFWMLVGAALWQLGCTAGPGPLALAWAFKASSTLDSMLGYRRGRLQWLGTAGARLDDALTWLPCRLVLLTLPLVSRPWSAWLRLVHAAERDGRPDPSPNAGRSQAIYAHCAGVRLGGANRYGERWVEKPLLAAGQPPVDATAVRRILNLSARLELLWLLLALGASSQPLLR
ncbi:adenosylcobinamide-phosphate synthase [Synechococcus sp. RS9909]|uniref:adenosylcobinamide-phosphate synthase CbiB n=1 Tax=unclassified Synechococcus TaxID=2626047 RepID=UPI000068FC73|nr:MULTISPECIES: adenosylcobinamide-phosphate synthase CbiB [unclassified Synechococcus]EAQ68096.1 cobalamin biosynthesis protein CobD [Synechococcus sp. RS9917]QNI78743.1 adenosylcobinamide-phosphate synthase [Synechococcus sp. RS9909]